MKERDLKFNDAINVRLLADSSNFNGQRVLTFLFSVPNIIHAEILRHRAGSFSISSNRAIPVSKLTKNDIFVPTSVGYNKSGMQATVPLNDSDLNHFQQLWISAYNSMKYIIAQIEPINVHKQHVNRLTMPFQVPTIVMTISENGLKNFLVQRNSEMAQPEIHELAILIEGLYTQSRPKVLKWGDWHLPFILENETELPLFDKLMINSARSARTSYRLNVEDRISNIDDDLKLATNLINDYHLSPFEHACMAFNPTLLNEVCKNLADNNDYTGIYLRYSNIYRNTYGFMQLRPLIEYVERISPLDSVGIIHTMVSKNLYAYDEWL
jgi:thymidylate synthase ThyX